MRTGFGLVTSAAGGHSRRVRCANDDGDAFGTAQVKDGASLAELSERSTSAEARLRVTFLNHPGCLLLSSAAD